MKILNIHGYKGSAKNSAYEALTALGHEVTSPELDYDTLSPDETLEMLLREAGECGAEMLVGSSLGGFYAAVMSVRLGLPAALVNPCLMPFLHLPRLGYNGEIRIVTDEDGKLIWKCPNCGNTDQNKMNVARRTCGYIGTQFWNQGRTQEIKERVLHL